MPGWGSEGAPSLLALGSLEGAPIFGFRGVSVATLPPTRATILGDQ